MNSVGKMPWEVFLKYTKKELAVYHISANL
jgi:hypothetical protein